METATRVLAFGQLTLRDIFQPNKGKIFSGSTCLSRSWALRGLDRQAGTGAWARRIASQRSVRALLLQVFRLEDCLVAGCNQRLMTL